MTATTDMIEARRKTRRALSFWRVAAVVGLTLAVLAWYPSSLFFSDDKEDDHVARIVIKGVIGDDGLRNSTLRDIADNDRIKALIVHINSPGGTVVGSEVLYEHLREIADKMPVIAVMGEAAASGGYITAIAADRIYARGNTITGSIGVVSDIPNIAGFLEMVGVEVNRVKSGPLKAEPSLTDRPSEAALADRDRIVKDSFNWFLDLVTERRGLEGERLDAVSDGRIFTGRQALERGLVDALGDEEDARDWLEAEKGIDAEMTISRYRWDRDTRPFPMNLFPRDEAGLWSPSRFMVPGPRLYAIMTD